MWSLPPAAPLTAKQKRVDSCIVIALKLHYYGLKIISPACWLPSILNWMKAAAWPSIGCDTLRSTLYNCIAPTTLANQSFRWLIFWPLIFLSSLIRREGQSGAKSKPVLLGRYSDEEEPILGCVRSVVDDLGRRRVSVKTQIEPWVILKIPDSQLGRSVCQRS